MFFLKLLSRLPLSVLYLFSDLLFFISYHLVGYRKKVISNNLKNSFPDKTDEELKKISRDFYHNLCDYLVETIKLLTITEGELRKRMVFKNPEVLQPFKDQNQSMLLLASHQFNWEWTIAAANLWLPVQTDYVYQPQRSELVNRFSLLCRGRFGSKAIKRLEVARDLIRQKALVRAVSIVADQFPGHGNDKRYWTTFLHQDTAFFEGVNNLATMLGYPAFFGRLEPVKRGYYEMEFVKIGEPPYEKGSQIVVENYIKETEKVIQRNPSDWLWSHNRWKKKRTD